MQVTRIGDFEVRRITEYEGPFIGPADFFPDFDGEVLRAKRARVLRAGERNSWLEIVLDEGKNRQIRRMLEQLEIEVLRLIRVAIGPLALGDLPKGKFRALDAAEKLALDRAMNAGVAIDGGWKEK